MSQVNVDLYVAPACHSVVGGPIKETMASTSTSVWYKVVPPSLTLMPDNSVPFHISGAFQAAALVLELRGNDSK